MMLPRLSIASGCLIIATIQVAGEVASPVTVQIAVERVQSASRTMRLVALVTPSAGLHVYAPGNPGFTPVDLKIESRPGLRIGSLELPPAEEFVFNLGESMKGYGRPFRVTRTVTFDEATWRALSTAIELKGGLIYQACTDTICFRTTTVGLLWKLSR
jgi:hypothetical protein